MKRRRDAGFSLAALIFFATAASIALAAAVPAYRLQAQREREEELIFRGEEYARAIQKYQRKFGVYPQNLEALLETNGLRFVRRAYKDPITDKPFRVISLNADGSVNGSTILNQRVNNTPLFGGNLQTLGQPQQQQQQTPAPRGQQPQQQGQPQGPPGQGGQRGQPGQQPLPGLGGFSLGPNGQVGNPQGNNVGLAGIIGVSSQSEEKSVKVYNNRQKYNEWEFIAVLGQPGQPGQPGVPGQPGQPSGGQTPFGQQPIGGPTQGQQPMPQQPFGIGQPQPQAPIQKR